MNLKQLFWGGVTLVGLVALARGPAEAAPPPPKKKEPEKEEGADVIPLESRRHAEDESLGSGSSIRADVAAEKRK